MPDQNTEPLLLEALEVIRDASEGDLRLAVALADVSGDLRGLKVEARDVRKSLDAVEPYLVELRSRRAEEAQRAASEARAAGWEEGRKAGLREAEEAQSIPAAAQTTFAAALRSPAGLAGALAVLAAMVALLTGAIYYLAAGITHGAVPEPVDTPTEPTNAGG